MPNLCGPLSHVFGFHFNLQKKFSLITDHWSPKIVAQKNDVHFKLAKIQGVFVWHCHAEVYIGLDTDGIDRYS